MRNAKLNTAAVSFALLLSASVLATPAHARVDVQCTYGSGGVQTCDVGGWLLDKIRSMFALS